MSRHDSVADVVRRLKPGDTCTFDSGHGSITVARSKYVDGFLVSGVTSASTVLTAGDAQADVARRRQIRDRAKQESGS